jgi:nitric oxide reductase NorQ protein
MTTTTPATKPAELSSAPTSPPGMRRTPSGRLGQGELRRQVAAHLAATSGEHTPGEVARALGARSSGAVANALETLVSHGQAVRTGSTPRRYRATTATSAAMAGPPATPSTSTPPAPGSAASRRPPTPESVPPRASSEAADGPVRRPNGQYYYPRRLADLPDVAALQRLRDAGIPALLYGPPGTGKTSLVEAAFGDLITVAGDGDTAVADFVGEYTQTPARTYEFIYGPLVTAMTEGRCLFIDDATLISPKVLAVVYPAMDGRRQITVKAHTGEVITAAEGFYVIAGHNPGVHGAVLTEALASRFSAQIHVTTDYDLARRLKIDPKAIKIARNLSARADKGVIGWAPQLRELIAFQKIADVLGRDAAVANLIGIAPDEDRDAVADVIRSVYGQEITPLSLGRQI